MSHTPYGVCDRNWIENGTERIYTKDSMHESSLQSSKSHFLELNSIVLWPYLTSQFRSSLILVPRIWVGTHSTVASRSIFTYSFSSILSSNITTYLWFHASSPKFTSESWISFTYYKIFQQKNYLLKTNKCQPCCQMYLLRWFSMIHA